MLLICFDDFLGNLRLTLNEIIRVRPGGLVVLAPCCRSFSRMSLIWVNNLFLSDVVVRNEGLQNDKTIFYMLFILQRGST